MQLACHTIGKEEGIATNILASRLKQLVAAGLLSRGADEEPDRVREAHGDAVYDRLAGVKAKYDPDNVFHHNQNIGPREMEARTVAA